MTVLPISPKIVVLGSGAWGTAIALSLVRTGRPVTLWAHSPAAAQRDSSMLAKQAVSAWV